MKNILFLFLILLYNLLQLVKSFSNKQIYSNHFLSNYNSNSIQQYSNYFLSNYFLSNYNSNSIQQYSNYFLSNYFLSNYNSNSIQQYSNYYNLLTSNYNSFNKYLSIITSTQFYPSSVSKSLPKSSGKINKYLSIITSTQFYHSSVSKSLPKSSGKINKYLSIITSTQFYPSSVSKSLPKTSGKNNEYLSIITSTQFYPSSVSKSLPKSSGKINEYLSIINTISSQYTSIIHYSTSVTTLNPTLNPTFIKPTLKPTFITTLNPTFIKPTLKPTTFITTLNPTFIPTFIPTLKPETPVLVFDTSLTFNNYATIELDTTSQKAIILATSNSMNISASYVEYIGSALKTRRLTIFKIQGYNIIVTVKTTLPLLGQTNPKLLYSTITGNLVSSVNSGLFTTYLIIASNTLGITSFTNSSILSVHNDDYIIQEPDKPYINSIKKVYTNYKIIYIIFGALLSVYLILYFIWFRKKYLNKIKRLRRLVDNMINTDDISIRIDEN
jgi:hypothetical protein